MYRFIKAEHQGELMNLWHLSKVPTSGMITERRYQRLLWTSKNFVAKFSEYSPTAVYKDLDFNTY